MNFEKAFNKLLRYEGKYANDPDDPGKETYKGISRRFNPGWEGWNIIDSMKETDGFPRSLEDSTQLQELVQKFYKEEYWDFFDGDKLPYKIAEELFESAVNVGKKRATIFMQATINILLNRKLKADGILGAKTKKNFKELLDCREVELIYNVLNIFQGCWYIELMLKNPSMRKYIGWFSRVRLLKYD